MSGDLEREQGAEEEVEIATSGATLAMLDKAVLSGVSFDVFIFLFLMIRKVGQALKSWSKYKTTL